MNCVCVPTEDGTRGGGAVIVVNSASDVANTALFLANATLAGNYLGRGKLKEATNPSKGV